MKIVSYHNLLKPLVLLLLLLNPSTVRADDFEIYRDGLVTIHYAKGLQGAAEGVLNLLPDIRNEIAMKLNINTRLTIYGFIRLRVKMIRCKYEDEDL